MPFCPKCNIEYKVDIYRCAKCGTDLVEQLPPQEQKESAITPLKQIKTEESTEQPEQEPGKAYLVTTWRGALIGSLICLVLASLISSGVKAVPTLAAIFRAAAWVLGIPLAMLSVGITFTVFASKTKEEAMSNLLVIAILSTVPLGIIMGLDNTGALDAIATVLVMSWLTSAVGYAVKPAFRSLKTSFEEGIKEASVKQALQESPKQEESPQTKPKEDKEPQKAPWALLSESEIKEYLKENRLKVDPTKYAPAKKSFGTISSILMPFADFMWKGVCPHCGWGISAMHVIGSFKALTKCTECGEFALLDREAERFFAVVPDKSSSKSQSRG